MAKRILTEYRLELCSLILMLSIFLTLIGVAGVFYSDGLPSGLSALDDLASPFGEWAYWLMVLGPIFLIGAVWWLYDYFKKTRSLARLIATPSKAKFVKNLDRIEELAWLLTTKEKIRVAEKKAEFRIKKR